MLVTIIDDDRPGCFAFHPDDVELAVLESEGAALLRVRRENGAKGEAFVDVVRSKQSGNPLYAFLDAGREDAGGRALFASWT